ncbi:TonB-dependent receptor [Vogesella fluminis]|uniref:TonB-dependent receptor n=2 Tax=Vogesella fluminis TaxID=1069161 RepID=A0ABQ3H895_9NEIS|nr:TonB-dependent receptor plug domain-containing protein [Vogesella fluminis]GHD72274.1 TonB-dependent receptor [Vogesella fluminis]
MPFRKNHLAWAVGIAILGIGQQAAADNTVTLPEVKVEGQSVDNHTRLQQEELASLKAQGPDAARLLQAVPGMSLRGAGGFSSLPVLRGLADDRLLVRTDDATVPASCPNHMNSPLSYMDASKVDSIQVYAGTAPVSVGGDNIGGVVIAESAPQAFATGGDLLVKGEVGAGYRSNGHASTARASATVANENISMSYTGSMAKAGNYKAAKEFKNPGGSSGRGWLDGDTVGSSSYETQNHELAVAMRGDRHLWEIKAGAQHSPYEGFANQRMDMTGNDSYQASTHYAAEYDWGMLDARLYAQYVRHSMQFGDDKQYTYGGYAGMPMETASHTQGGTLTATLAADASNTWKVGGEFQRYRLDDWWPAVGMVTGMMSPDTFQNINNGKRDRLEAFGELAHRWSDTLDGLFGLRLGVVDMNSDKVAGYNTMPAYATDAAAFNARDRHQTDYNVDLSMQLNFQPEAGKRYELAYARKTRSPNLYERYSWSSMGMAAVMNNYAGDGNGYFGNVSLKPEVAHNLSLASVWNDAANERWSIKFTPYYSYVENYIDAERCGTALCGGSTNLTVTDRYVTLRYVNQNAELYGADLDGKVALWKNPALGQIRLTGKVSYTRGRNLTTGDNLYNIMPLNGTFGLQQEQGAWRNTLEWQLVAAKHKLSRERNEFATPGYGLLNLRSRYQQKNYSIDFGVENLLNHHYTDPLGGAYTGQGRTMSKNGIAWGVGVPGPARSFYAGMTYSF